MCVADTAAAADAGGSATLPDYPAATASRPKKKRRPAPAEKRVVEAPRMTSAYRQDVDPQGKPSAAAKRRSAIRRAAFEDAGELEAPPGVDPFPAEDLGGFVPGANAAAQPTQPSFEPQPEAPANDSPRRFRNIADIKPFYDYEPDPNVLNTDKCFNLCPRPIGPDCPDCEVADPSKPPSGRYVCPECPTETALKDLGRDGAPVVFVPRNFPHMHYCWEPTNLYHYPLYFEDACLERYGHSRHYLIQPIFSGMLMGVQAIGLPYQMTIDPMCKKRYTLGWYRPGKFVPYKYYQVPWNTEAALVEAGFVAGGYFLWAPGITP